jgi:hypothetical protein
VDLGGFPGLPEGQDEAQGSAWRRRLANAAPERVAQAPKTLPESNPAAACRRHPALAVGGHQCCLRRDRSPHLLIGRA